MRVPNSLLPPCTTTSKAIPGTLLWAPRFTGTDRSGGPNLGDIALIGSLVEGAITAYLFYGFREESHEFKITFTPDGLTVEESNYLGVYGMGVTFIGEYRRA
jgi:hypothetical protein